MCTLNQHLNQKTATGYKVVAKDIKTGKYYSYATGIEYVSGKCIKIPKMQKSITDYFCAGLLFPNANSSSAYQSNMIGRTAAFITIEGCVGELGGLLHERHESYKPVIIEVILSKELMSGWYGASEVIAGKKINIIIREVKL